ncbi:MAG: phosphate ABC transporter substrate-binding protein [Bacteroidales bacterium]
MKGQIILFFLWFLFLPSSQAQRIKGSDTTLPLTQRLAEAFLKQNKGVKISVTGGGSGVGIAALEESNTDIAMSSRTIKPEETERLRRKNKKPKETIIAYDALAVIVNPQNPVSKLTREQLEGIFRGKIKNWKEVGGENQKIIVYTRESSSGTYDFFLQKVMKRRNFSPAALSMPATGAIQESIRQTPGAIGYVGVSYIDHLKPIAVSFDKGKNYYLPDQKNTEDGKYPIIRPLYFYYLPASYSLIKPFLSFIQSSEGEKIISTMGYIPCTRRTNSD